MTAFSFRLNMRVMAGVVAVMALTACQSTGQGPDPHANSKSGALIGGLLGASVGALSGDNPAEATNKAVKGAILGASAGALIGSSMDRREAQLRRELENQSIAVENTGDSLVVTFPQDILFDEGGTTIRPDHLRDLRVMSHSLKTYPDTRYEVIGHSDDSGDTWHDIDLSNQRAAAVAKVMVGQGIPAYMIETLGRGSSEPVATNMTAEGRARNRRVEIIILPTS